MNGRFVFLLVVLLQFCLACFEKLMWAQAVMYPGVSSRRQSCLHAGIAGIPSVLDRWRLLDFRYYRLESEIKKTKW